MLYFLFPAFDYPLPIYPCFIFHLNSSHAFSSQFHVKFPTLYPFFCSLTLLFVFALCLFSMLRCLHCAFVHTGFCFFFQFAFPKLSLCSYTFPWFFKKLCVRFPSLTLLSAPFPSRHAFLSSLNVPSFHFHFDWLFPLFCAIFTILHTYSFNLQVFPSFSPAAFSLTSPSLLKIDELFYMFLTYRRWGGELSDYSYVERRVFVSPLTINKIWSRLQV